MSKVASVILLFLFIARAQAQTPVTDPLDPSFKPPFNTDPAAYPNNIWITGPLEKVLQDKGAPGPAHWITIHATKNEFQSFQVHVHAGSNPINALTVSMSDLVNMRTATRISAGFSDIVVYREAYENVNIKTATGATFLNTTGHIPDILIPAFDPYYRQKTNAFPFTVAPGNNQSAWIDVHIPPGVPSGYYNGFVTVRDGTTVLATMPVIYAVWDWEMPSTATLPSHTGVSYGGFCIQTYGSIPGCSAYPGANGGSDFGVTLVNVDAAVQMLDNRYSLSGLANIFPGSGPFSTTDGSASFDKIYAPLLRGDQAHVPGILKGARLTSWNMKLLPPQVNAATFQNFQKHFASNGWQNLFYYLIDEPNPNDAAVWKDLVAKGNAARSFSNPGIPIMVTTDMVLANKYGALNSIDWLVVDMVNLEPGDGHPMQDLSAYQKWLAANPARRFWSYQGCSNAGTCTNGVTGPQYKGAQTTYPNYNVDGTAVANRLMEWMTYLHGQSGELYYYIDVCDGPGGVSTQCGYPAAGNNYNPLVSNYYSGGWGDGTLMYPGSSSYVGTKIPIWMPSMRLKMIRDGMQDYEYLFALTKLGYGSLVTNTALSFITNSYTFSNDPARLEGARAILGSKLHELARTSRSTTPAKQAK